MAKKFWSSALCCLCLPLALAFAEEPTKDGKPGIPKIEKLSVEWEKFDSPLWEQGKKLGNFKLSYPYGKASDAPKEQTIVTLAHDGKNLFIRFTALDANPKEATAKALCNYKESRPLGDMGKMMLNGSWKKNIFEFDCNGNKYDSRDLDKDWNSGWKLRARKTDKSWEAVMMISFASLDFNPADPKAKLRGFFGREYSHGAKDPEESGLNGGAMVRSLDEITIEQQPGEAK